MSADLARSPCAPRCPRVPRSAAFRPRGRTSLSAARAAARGTKPSRGSPSSRWSAPGSSPPRRTGRCTAGPRSHWTPGPGTRRNARLSPRRRTVAGTGASSVSPSVRSGPANLVAPYSSGPSPRRATRPDGQDPRPFQPSERARAARSAPATVEEAGGHRALADQLAGAPRRRRVPESELPGVDRLEAERDHESSLPSVVTAGGDRRATALAGSLCLVVHAVTGLTNKSLRGLVAGLLGTDYAASQLSYDLRRLRLHGLTARVPRTKHLRRHPRGHPRRRHLHQAARPTPRATPRSRQATGTSGAPSCPPHRRPRSRGLHHGRPSRDGSLKLVTRSRDSNTKKR